MKKMKQININKGQMQAKEIQQKELNSTKNILTEKRILLSYTEKQQQIHSTQIY